MNQETKIVGICLVKNEDLYIHTVLTNILDFCDKIIILDNMSTDHTDFIVREFEQKYPSKITAMKWTNPLNSGLVLQEYIGTNTWVFGVDGDEIYDPEGLKAVKQKIKSGECKEYWRIGGHALHCEHIDFKTNLAKGYLAPPSRPVAKLFNFNLMESWPQNERLHGANHVFKEGAKENTFPDIVEKLDWDKSYFRCLHACFVPRSSLDNSTLRNIVWAPSNWKNEKYKRGKLTEKDISAFYKE